MSLQMSTVQRSLSSFSVWWRSEPAYAQRRDGGLLPQDQSGQVTAVGCLVRGSAVRGGKEDKYVLARPKKGPVASVPEATCTADPGADALTSITRTKPA